MSLDPSSAVRANRDAKMARATFADPDDSPPRPVLQKHGSRVLMTIESSTLEDSLMTAYRSKSLEILYLNKNVSRMHTYVCKCKHSEKLTDS